MGAFVGLSEPIQALFRCIGYLNVVFLAHTTLILMKDRFHPEQAP